MSERKRTRRSALLALMAVALVSPAVAQDDVQIKTVPVSGGVSMLIGRGGNIGVSAGEDGVFLIDDQYAPLTDSIRAAVEELGAGPVRFVLNTHWHGDHTGGNERFGEAGALIVAHDNVRERMSTEQFNALWDRTTPPSPDGALPVVTFSEDVTFHLNGDAIHAFHVAHAHTDGDVIVHFRVANAVHMGDVYFPASYPFIDLDSGGSIGGVIAAVERVIGMTDDGTAVIPGHGDLSDRAGLVDYHAMLVAIQGRVQALIADGKTLDEAIATQPTADYDARWGGGFIGPDVFTRIVYTSLTAAE